MYVRHIESNLDDCFGFENLIFSLDYASVTTVIRVKHTYILTRTHTCTHIQTHPHTHTHTQRTEEMWIHKCWIHKCWIHKC